MSDSIQNYLTEYCSNVILKIEKNTQTYMLTSYKTRKCTEKLLRNFCWFMRIPSLARGLHTSGVVSFRSKIVLSSHITEPADIFSIIARTLQSQKMFLRVRKP